MRSRRAAWLSPVLRHFAALLSYGVLAVLLLPALSTDCLAQGGPPVITTQPLSQSRPIGSSVTFTVVVSSVTFPTYQWRFNGTNIPDATVSTYTIGNVQSNLAGNYSVAITNAVGYVISSNALLTVTPPPFTVVAWGNNSNGQATVPARSGNSGTQIFNTGGGCVPEDPICGNPVGCSVFLSIVTPDPGSLFLNTDGSSFDTLMAVYRRSPTNPLVLVLVACDDDSGVGLASALTVPVTAGVTNFIQIGGYNGAYGTLRFNYQFIPAPDVMKAIAAGGEHSLALRTNGTVLAWGGNTHGQTNVPADLSNVTAIAAGYYHSVALKSDGTVVAWGRNSDGETNVPPGLSNVVALSAGCYHNLALRNDGTVVAWGRNSSGETNVPPGLSNVVFVAAGCSHSLALKDNGLIVGWGDNDHGQLNVPLGLANVAALSAGDDFSLALRANRTVVSWGDNSNGQTNVPVGLSNVVAIAGGGSHCLALRANGTITGWGQNTYDQTNVPSGLSNMIAIAAGAAHSLALRGDGSVVITVQPRNQRVYRYAPATFAAMAAGNPPIFYQWRFNDTNLLGASGSTYTLSNALPADAGAYRVDVFNASGGAISSNAMLAVEYPTARLLSPRSQSSSVQFSVELMASSDSPVPVAYSIQGSTNFVDWINLQVGLLSFTNQASISFGELIAPSPSRRFYRVVLP
jgi:alpha-tubulin suppressor-like RCC1 family protein